uniref:Reverse transcriptase domain-containing protein n=1 Tax=Amphimedon queenslandica TaxID=400682 RepID=A0A1X7TDD6_AMPQE
MWKLLTGVLAEYLYIFFESNELLPEEQKGCRRGSKGTKDQLLIDKMVLRDCKKRRTNLSLAWIDYKKAYDMVPHSWIVECLDMMGCAENVRNLLEKSMSQWKCELNAGGTVLGEVPINRGIFQGDSLSPLLFVVCLVPLTMVLHKVKVGYEMSGKVKINHLLFMDDLKLYGKTEEQIESLVNTVQLVSDDIGMEFGVAKCGMLVLKRGKVVKSEGIILPSGDVVKEIEEEGYRYLGILEKDEILSQTMKEKIMGEYYRRLRLILRSKLNGKNKMMGINMWVVAVIWYGGGIVDWRQEELKK